MARGRDPKAFAKALEHGLAGRPSPERKWHFVGILNRHLPKGARAILVGGGAVELYTAGAYVTADIDLVGDRDAILRLLEAAGFDRAGRVFVREDLGLAVDVVDSTLRKGETVTEIEAAEVRFPVVTPEDAIVDRLLAAKSWDSRTDWEQAVLLFEAQRDRLDLETLLAKATANEVEDRLGKLVQETTAARRDRRDRSS